jgi:hypothetical protein
MADRHALCVSSAKLVKETDKALCLEAADGSHQWWPKSQTTVLSRSFTPAAGCRVMFEAPVWLHNANATRQRSHALGGYNVEFQGARPARAGEDY